MTTKGSLSHIELLDLGIELSDQELAKVSGGSWSDEGPKETITFVYGKLGVQYSSQ